MTATTPWTPTIANCDQYLGDRTGKYEWRAVRYRAAAKAMRFYDGLLDSDTVVDVGAGWTEFDYCLRAEFGWRGRYSPVDGGLDGTDLNSWTPPRKAEWFVGLEIVEHLTAPFLLLEKLKLYATKGIILSTPNPRTTDVLGMDPTHVRPIEAWELENTGFVVTEATFYGQESDSLFAIWLPPLGRWNASAAV